MEPAVDIQNLGSQTIFRMLLDPKQVSQADANASQWYDRVVKPKLAQLAERPAFQNVVTLESKREQCQSEIATREQAIADVRASLRSGSALGDDAAVAKAVTEIDDHETALRRLRLTVESIDSVLPDATRSRQEDCTRAIRELQSTLVEDTNKRLADNAREVTNRVGKGAAECLELHCRLGVLANVKEQAFHTSAGFVESMVGEVEGAGKH